MALERERERQSLSSIEEEIQSAENREDYEAVDVLWVALLKLANRMQGTNEHRRMHRVTRCLRDRNRLLDSWPPGRGQAPSSRSPLGNCPGRPA